MVDLALTATGPHNKQRATHSEALHMELPEVQAVIDLVGLGSRQPLPLATGREKLLRALGGRVQSGGTSTALLRQQFPDVAPAASALAWLQAMPCIVSWCSS